MSYDEYDDLENIYRSLNQHTGIYGGTLREKAFRNLSRVKDLIFDQAITILYENAGMDISPGEGPMQEINIRPGENVDAILGGPFYYNDLLIDFDNESTHGRYYRIKTFADLLKRGLNTQYGINMPVLEFVRIRDFGLTPPPIKNPFTNTLIDHNTVRIVTAKMLPIPPVGAGYFKNKLFEAYQNSPETDQEKKHKQYIAYFDAVNKVARIGPSHEFTPFAIADKVAKKQKILDEYRAKIGGMLPGRPPPGGEFPRSMPQHAISRLGEIESLIANINEILGIINGEYDDDAIGDAIGDLLGNNPREGMNYYSTYKNDVALIREYLNSDEDYLANPETRNLAFKSINRIGIAYIELLISQIDAIRAQHRGGMDALTASVMAVQSGMDSIFKQTKLEEIVNEFEKALKHSPEQTETVDIQSFYTPIEGQQATPEHVCLVMGEHEPYKSGLCATLKRKQIQDELIIDDKARADGVRIMHSLGPVGLNYLKTTSKASPDLYKTNIQRLNLALDAQSKYGSV